MQVFKDNANRDWTLPLNIGAAMLVKDKLGIDLLQPEVGDPPLLTRLGTDEMLLVQVIATLLEGQFEKYNIDTNQIYQSFDGVTFTKAHEAFYKELIDFFQSRGRHERAKAVEKQKKMILAGVLCYFFGKRQKSTRSTSTKSSQRQCVGKHLAHSRKFAS